MIPSNALRESIVRAARALMRRKERLVLLAGVFAAGMAVLALAGQLDHPFLLQLRPDYQRPFQRPFDDRDQHHGGAGRSSGSQRYGWELLPFRQTGGAPGIAPVFGARAAPRTSGVRPVRALLRHRRSGRGGYRDQIAQLVRIFQRTRAAGLKMAVADGLGDVGDADAVEALGRLYSWAGPSYGGSW